MQEEVINYRIPEKNRYFAAENEVSQLSDNRVGGRVLLDLVAGGRTEECCPA